MSRPTVSRTVRVALAGALAAIVVLATLLVGAAVGFERHEVRVVDDAYEDGEGDVLHISLGDRVVWRWDDANQNEHTVTALQGEFDSDAPCADGDTAPCRRPGHLFAHTFEEPGTYRYRCRVHLTMWGTIEVSDAASDPSPSPSESGGDPSGDPSGGPSHGPTDGPTVPAPTSSGSPSERPSPSPDESDGDGSPLSPGERRTTDGNGGGSASLPRVPGFSFQPGPVRTFEPAPGSDPDVAPPLEAVSPSFEPFPSPPPLPTSSDETIDIAIPTGRDGPPRGLVTGIAVASVLGSAGAVGRVILRG